MEHCCSLCTICVILSLVAVALGVGFLVRGDYLSSFGAFGSASSLQSPKDFFYAFEYRQGSVAREVSKIGESGNSPSVALETTTTFSRIGENGSPVITSTTSVLAPVRAAMLPETIAQDLAAQCPTPNKLAQQEIFWPWVFDPAQKIPDTSNRSKFSELQEDFQNILSGCINASTKALKDQQCDVLIYPPKNEIGGERVAILVSGEFRDFPLVKKSLAKYFWGRQTRSDAFLDMRIQSRRKFDKVAKSACEAWRGNGGLVHCKRCEQQLLQTQLICVIATNPSLRHFAIKMRNRYEPRVYRFFGQLFSLWRVYEQFRKWESSNPHLKYTTLVRMRADGYLQQVFPFDYVAMGADLQRCGGIALIRKDNHAILPRALGDCFFGRFQVAFSRALGNKMHELRRLACSPKFGCAGKLTAEHFLFSLMRLCNAQRVDLRIKNFKMHHFNVGRRSFRRVRDDSDRWLDLVNISYSKDCCACKRNGIDFSPC